MELRTHALALLLRALAPAPDVDPALACPDTAPLAGRIEELVGRPVAPSEVGVRLAILETEPLVRARVELEFGGRVEVRDLEAKSCDALLDAVALLVAVTLDPSEAPQVPEPPPPEPPPLQTAEPEPQPVPELEPEPQPAPPPEPTPPSEPESPAPRPTSLDQRRALGLAVGLFGGGEIGAIPRGTGGIRPVLRLSRGAFVAELSGDYWIRRRHQPLPTGETITVELGVAALRAGWALRRGAIRVPFCGGLEAGLMRGEGFGLRDSRSDHWPWAAALASAGVLVRLGARVDLGATIEGVVPFVRPTFTAARDDGSIVTLHTPSPVGARLLAGVSVELLGRRGRPNFR